MPISSCHENLSSISAGFTKGINIYIIDYYAGSHLIANVTIQFQDMFTRMTVITTASFVSNSIKTEYAALTSYRIVERATVIDRDLEKIVFVYPARPDISILTDDFGFQGSSG